MTFNPLTIIMLVLLAVVIIFMFRSSRKRQRDAASLRDKIQPGADVMTNFGMFGKLLSIDEEENYAFIETTPGTIIKVHRQVIARVVEPTEAQGATVGADAPVIDADADLTTPTATSTRSAVADAPRTEPEVNVDHATPLPAPEYGERVEKPTRGRTTTGSGE